jgi:hypothetical protein
MMARTEPGIRDKLNREFRGIRRCIWPGCAERNAPWSVDELTAVVRDLEAAAALETA